MELKKGDIVVWVALSEPHKVVDFFLCLKDKNVEQNYRSYYSANDLVGYNIVHGNRYELGNWNFKRKATQEDMETIMQWLKNNNKYFNFNTGSHERQY